MMNINKLRGKIVEQGLNIEGLAKLMKMNRSTLYRKLNNQGDTFTVKEINMLYEILFLTKDEAIAIFFTNSVA